MQNQRFFTLETSFFFQRPRVDLKFFYLALVSKEVTSIIARSKEEKCGCSQSSD
jgi:hypothetical protein